MNTFEKKNQGKLSYKSPEAELVALPREDILTASKLWGDWDEQQPSYNKIATGSFEI